MLPRWGHTDSNRQPKVKWRTRKPLQWQLWKQRRGGRITVTHQQTIPSSSENTSPFPKELQACMKERPVTKGHSWDGRVSVKEGGGAQPCERVLECHGTSVSCTTVSVPRTLGMYGPHSRTQMTHVGGHSPWAFCHLGFMGTKSNPRSAVRRSNANHGLLWEVRAFNNRLKAFWATF